MSFFKKTLFLYLALPLFFGCFQKDIGAEHSHYSIGASLYLPEKWERITLEPALALSSMAFTDNREGSILLTQNLRTSYSQQLQAVSQKNYPVLEKGVLLFSKYKTKSFLSVENRMTQFTYVIKAPKGRVFSLVCSAPSINFISYRPDFERIARSFRAY